MYSKITDFCASIQELCVLMAEFQSHSLSDNFCIFWCTVFHLIHNDNLHSYRHDPVISDANENDQEVYWFDEQIYEEKGL